uniref:CHK domain-containing protein n=1 Tax=Rhabditophanes sp. KR3021 TaxID=114890 RepID=A0AC35U457_9BILA
MVNLIAEESGGDFMGNELGEQCFPKTDTKHLWAIQCLQDNCEEFRKLRQDSKIVDIITEDIGVGKAFVSRVLKVSISFDHNTDIFICILKVTNSNINARSKAFPYAHLTVSLHNREVYFINKLSDIKDLNVPLYYGSKECIPLKQDGVILMQYLGNSHGQVEYFNSLTMEQAQSVVDQIFLLQSHFLVSPNADLKPIVEAKDIAFIFNEFETNFDLVKQYAPEEMWKETEDEIYSLVSHASEIVDYIMKELPFEKGNQSVFVQGDVFSNTYLFKKCEHKNNNELSEEVTLFDFQVCCNGSIGNDLSNLFICNVDPDLRNELEEILPHYFEKLKDDVIAKGGLFDMTWQMFKQNYDINLIEKALLFCMFFGKELSYSLPPDGSSQTVNWNKKKNEIAVKTMCSLNDAVFVARRLKPEWLILK